MGEDGDEKGDRDSMSEQMADVAAKFGGNLKKGFMNFTKGISKFNQ